MSFTLNKVNKLDDSALKYQSFFHSAPTAILVINLTNREILESNERFHGLFGFSDAELKSMSLSDLLEDSDFRVNLNTKDLSVIYSNKDSVVREKEDAFPSDFVSYAKNKNGDRFLARFKCVNVGESKKYQLVYINRADGFIQSLHWRSIVENLPSAALLLKRSGEIIYANRVSEPYNVNSVVGTSAMDYIPLDSKQNFANKLQEVFELSKSVRFETEVYAFEQIRTYQVDIIPIKEEPLNQIEFALSIGQDVTQIVSSRKEKRELDSAFSKLQHVAHIGSWSFGPQNKIMHWSEEILHIFGVDREEINGDFRRLLASTIYPDDRPQLEDIISKIQNQKSAEWSSELRIRRPNDGKLRYLWCGGENVFNDSGKYQKSIGFVQDVSAFKLMQLGLGALANCNADGGGRALIKELMKSFLASTGLDIAYIANVSADHQSLDTWLFIDRGEVLENFSYSMEGTPCEHLLAESYYCVPQNVQKGFAEDSFLVVNGIQSYIGISLRDINDRVIAILVSLHREEFEYPEVNKTLLQATANRIASEMARMRTQEELENSELHFRNAITSAEIVTWEWDLRSNNLTWSDNVKTLLGCRPGNFWSFQELLHPKDRAKVLDHIEYSVKRGSSLNVEFRIIKGQRRDIWVRMKGRNLELTGSHDDKFMGIISDITAEKNALIENRKITSRLNMHIQHTPLGFIELDRDCKVVKWNPAAEKIFGYTNEEALGRSVLNLIVPSTLKTNLLVIWNSLVSNTGGDRASHENVTKTGRIIHCDWHNTPLVDDNGEVIGVACLVEDISERINIENELRSHREHLEELVNVRTSEIKRINRELQAFSYSVSHDLRAPLRAIDGFSQILIEEYSAKLDSDARSYLDRVRKGAQNMATLIDDLLKLSRISRGQVRKKEFDLSRLAAEVVDQLTQDYPQRIVKTVIEPKLKIYADRGLIQVALENLLGNAWKYSAVQPNALVEFRKVTQDNKAVVFVVSDNGVGFDMKYVDKLFGAFQRLHEKDKQFEGSGIGLATVQRIIRLHGGRVWAEGKVKQGAKFYFSLPVKGSESEVAENKFLIEHDDEIEFFD